MRLALVVLGVAAALATATPTGPASVGSTACAPPLIGAGAIGEGRNNPDLMPPTVGELRILLLFVDFPDARGRRDPRLIRDETLPALDAWYRTVSYGRLRIEAELVPRWITLAHDSAYYRQGGALEEALATVTRDVDLSRIHALYVTPAGATNGGWVVIADKPIVAAHPHLRALAWNALGNAIHETGHVLGLPDLYVSGVPWSFYRWDVMAGGSRPSGLYAWHRWKLGWLDADQIACLAGRGRVEATVAPLERTGGTKAVVVRVGAKAYIAEVRQRLAEDATICKTGVLVYEVDLAGARRPIWLRAARPDGGAETGVCGGRWRAPFDLGRGETSRVTVGGVRFELLRKLPDGSYRIRATRSR